MATTKIRRLEERIDRMKREITEIKKRLHMLPKIETPIDWKAFNELDQKILRLLMRKGEDKFLSSVDISKKLGVDRTKIWRHLKKIHKVSLRIRGAPILIYDPSLRMWGLNREEYDFEQIEKIDREKS